MNDLRQEYVTATQLAKILHISRQSVAYNIHNGKIKAKKFGKCWRIPIDEVERIKKEGF